ncbi:transglycosylase domain-containing protein [Sulfuriroseicoccus oceanibius]|uniref:Transglycosylase domain-containing protein n=1 Tax=Sulfuriroseicoccus oceanibius TaxID=2707525 RepID=A0A7T7F1V9_9BACT|nr:transglycosylase domain-containing protein [Sulfuriroseicoccus oceanibius]QQL45285.1 transglycosylase domain-containing protein [Sulfuriroseicoccus oceanibius]
MAAPGPRKRTTRKKSTTKKKAASSRGGAKKKAAKRKAPAKRARRKRPAARRKKGSFKQRFLRLALLSGILGFLGLAVVLFVYARMAASYDLSDISRMPERSRILDVKGREIGSLHGENRETVPLGEVSPVFIDALLAREDSRFYEHGGVDYFGVVRAAIRNVKEMSNVQGASTLSMQLARNRFGLKDKTYHRKLLEVMITRRLEAMYSKDQLLEAYVNLIYYGSGIYGIQRASEVYFEKPARDLTTSEAAMLAGIIRGPTPFSPFRNLDAAKDQMRQVLDRMVDTGALTVAEAEAAKKAPVHIRPPERRIINDTYALDIVRRELDLLLDDELAVEGGLQIFTTLDTDLQSAALTSLNSHLESIEALPGYRHQKKADFHSAVRNGVRTAPRYLQGAVVVIDNKTGGIRAIVGGRDLRDSSYNRAIQAKRQVGSIFKPMVYATAFSKGMLQYQRVDDGPIRPGEIQGAPRSWRPSNSDGKYMGIQPAEVGLIKSRNTMTVRVGNYAGLKDVKYTADAVGLGYDLPNGPSIFLGSFESTLKDITSAYTVFPNGGMKNRPFVISQIRTRDGRIVYNSGVMGSSVIAPGAAQLTGRVLEKAMMAGGTGVGARSLGFRAPAGGKTGTTNDYRDAWFVGFTESLTAGVWVGLDQNQRTIGGGYGSRLALPVWTQVMLTAQKNGYPMGELGFGRDLVSVSLCRESGLLATKFCRQAGLETNTRMPKDLKPARACGHKHDNQRSWLERTFSR